MTARALAPRAPQAADRRTSNAGPRELPEPDPSCETSRGRIPREREALGERQERTAGSQRTGRECGHDGRRFHEDDGVRVEQDHARRGTRATTRTEPHLTPRPLPLPRPSGQEPLVGELEIERPASRLGLRRPTTGDDAKRLRAAIDHVSPPTRCACCRTSGTRRPSTTRGTPPKARRSSTGPSRSRARRRGARRAS